MKVVLAIDDSQESDAVIESVVQRLWPSHTEFFIVMAVQSADLEDDIMKRRCLSALKKIARRHQSCSVDYEIITGVAEEVITQFALKLKADRIIMGCHPHDLCPRYLNQGVAARVKEIASCKVEIAHSVKKESIKELRKESLKV